MSREMHITIHAIDRLSERCLEAWFAHRRDASEGIVAWMQRAATEALELVERGMCVKSRDPRRITVEVDYAGVHWTLEHRQSGYCVVTVLPQGVQPSNTTKLRKRRQQQRRQG